MKTFSTHPIVTQRSTRNQVTYGFGVAYAWR
ncbi:hypothetical protein FHX62_005233 [Cupriavidus alkaliphilus]|nr:hypothetical protein [Cupriavidus alkaliphilus]MBB3016543.1 hypothetical protein [Cupriavidus alkaliphilus]